MSLSKAQLRRLQNGSGRERIVYNLLQNSERVMGTILLGNLFVNTLLTALTAEIIARFLHSAVWGAVFSIVIVTPVIILAGELLPKITCLKHNLAMARFCAPILLFLSRLLTPLLWILNGITSLCKRLFGLGKGAASWEELTSAEVNAAFKAAASTGGATTREHDLLERIMRFGTIRAKEIMIPRPQITAIDDSLTLQQLVATTDQCNFNYLPVYHRNIDEIWGVLAFTDILRLYGTPQAQVPLASFRNAIESGKESDEMPVSGILFFPGSARIDSILEKMRMKSLRLAVVVSEYGGTLGLLTRSMLLEEIVGRYATSGRDVNRLIPHHGSFMADGRIRMRILGEALECHFDDTETDSLAGFVMERLGRVPACGDFFTENGFRFQVIRTVGQIASAVNITPVKQEDGQC